jgi:methionine-rich copper-binding protein CopC
LLHQLEKEREKMLLERKSSSTDLAGSAVAAEPVNPDAAAVATDNLLTSPSSTTTATTNRLSVNFDEMLKDFHSADIKLTENDETSTNKRRQEYIKLFLHADRIYSSPLTRALETAVLSMEGHRAAKASGITLYR